MKACFKIFVKANAFMGLMLVVFLGTVYCFFSDSSDLSGVITTGSVDISIEDVNINHNIYNQKKLGFKSETKSEVLEAGTLEADTIVPFKFTIKNNGLSMIKYDLSLGITFDLEILEFGRFLIYPYAKSNEDIYHEVANHYFDNAIIGLNIEDLKQVPTSSGIKSGMLETMDSNILESNSSKNSSKITSKEYQYKLLFYIEEKGVIQPQLFEGKSLEISIITAADINGVKSNWEMSKNSFLKFSCTTNVLRPIIEEIEKPKTYFINQADKIDLASYATAYDLYDGDITQLITISSVPSFDSKKAGTYNITYEVINSKGNSAIPLEISIVIWDFTKITSGNYHTLALTSHGFVYSWGYNSLGQLGDGTTAYKANPILVDGLENIIDIATGYYSSYALDSSGQVYGWGGNGDGQLGDGTTSTKYRPTRVHQPVGVKFIKISSRFYNAGGITAEGDVYTWGYAGYGSSGNGSSVENHVPTKINLSNIVHLEMGYYNGAAITKDGDVYTWGDNLHGQLGTGRSMAVSTNAPEKIVFFTSSQIQIKDISVGWYHMIATTTTGDVYTWGYGAEGRLGNGSTSDKNIPQLISIAEDVTMVLAGYFHTAILTVTGRVYFFGQNSYGKFGNGNGTLQITPLLLEPISDIKYISIAYESSFVLTNDSVVYGMGYGGTGVLGTGNSNSSNVPVKWAFVPPEPF